MAAAWATDGGYTDPPSEGGPSWELVSDGDGSAPVAGSDVITLDAAGRIRSVLGFLGRVPAGA